MTFPEAPRTPRCNPIRIIVAKKERGCRLRLHQHRVATIMLRDGHSRCSEAGHFEVCLKSNSIDRFAPPRAAAEEWQQVNAFPSTRSPRNARLVAPTGGHGGPRRNQHRRAPGGDQCRRASREAAIKSPAYGPLGFSWSHCFLFIKTQNYILITATVEIESIIHKLRVRLLNEVRYSELVPMERIGRARIVAAITVTVRCCHKQPCMAVLAMQSVVLILFVALYVAYVSLTALLISMGIVAGRPRYFISRVARSPRANARPPSGQIGVRSPDRRSGRVQGSQAEQAAKRSN